MRWLYGNPEGRSEVSDQAKAMQPEDVTRIVAERLNAGDAAGVAALYEPQAVLAYPAGRPVTGREAIQAIYQQMVAADHRPARGAPAITPPGRRLETTALVQGCARSRPPALPGAASPAGAPPELPGAARAGRSAAVARCQRASVQGAAAVGRRLGGGLALIRGMCPCSSSRSAGASAPRGRCCQSPRSRRSQWSLIAVAGCRRKASVGSPLMPGQRPCGGWVLKAPGAVSIMMGVSALSLVMAGAGGGSGRCLSLLGGCHVRPAVALAAAAGTCDPLG